MIKIPSTWSIGHIRLDMNTPIILPKIKRALQRILRKILAVFYFGGFLWYLKYFKGYVYDSNTCYNISY